VNFKSDKVYPQ